MSDLNPELKKQVQSLAQLCARAVEGENVDLEGEAAPTVATLVTGGFHRLSDRPLADCVEQQAVDQIESLAIHRRAQLRSFCEKIQAEFDERLRWHASQPEHRSQSRPANISSATDA